MLPLIATWAAAAACGEVIRLISPQGIIPPTPPTTASVRYWSDFNRMYYHPRSSVQINEYQLNSGIQPFEGYGLGQELFKSLNREHDMIDRDFRLFAEECDQMQGIQILTSADDAWAGFTGEYISELRDEYGKVNICTWGLERSERVVRVSSPATLFPVRFGDGLRLFRWFTGDVPTTKAFQLPIHPRRSPLCSILEYIWAILLAVEINH